MSVYKRSDGIYLYDFWDKGVRFFGPTGSKNRDEAKRIEDEVRKKAKEQLKVTRESATAPITVNVALDKFWNEVGEHYNGTYKATVWASLKWLHKELGGSTLIRDINSNQIAELVAKRRGQNVSNATVNRTVTELMRRILKRAKNVWEQEVKTIKWSDHLLKEPKERVRELREQEEERLTSSMRNDYRPALAFFIASGCRLKEVVSLRWGAIDWHAKTLEVLGKGDVKAIIPLTTEMQAILSPLKGHHPEFVFTYIGQRSRNSLHGKTITKGKRYPITYSGLKTTWRRYGGAAAGLKDFRLHDTRHTAATRLLRETGNLKMVQRLLRHEDIATTVKYAHVTIEDLRGGMEKVAKSRSKSRMKPVKK